MYRMYRDRLSKPAADRYFPYSAHEFIGRIAKLNFAVHSYDERLSVFLENCCVECSLGYQLCSLFRKGYIAQFSLPNDVPHDLARKAIDAALTRLREIDAGPHLVVRNQQFVIYRAYLGPLGKVSVAQHVAGGGHRSFFALSSSISTP